MAAKKLPQNEPLHKASILPEESIVTESVSLLKFSLILMILIFPPKQPPSDTITFTKKNEKGVENELMIGANKKINFFVINKDGENNKYFKMLCNGIKKFQYFQVSFDVVMRILNREWNPYFANRSTREFRQLAAEVINRVGFFLNMLILIFDFKIKGFRSIQC